MLRALHLIFVKSILSVNSTSADLNERLLLFLLLLFLFVCFGFLLKFYRIWTLDMMWKLMFMGLNVCQDNTFKMVLFFKKNDKTWEYFIQIYDFKS